MKVQQKADEHQENVAQNESQGGDQVVDDHCYKILPAPKTKIMQDDADKQSEEVVDRRRKLEIAEHLYADPIPAPNVDTREEEAASGRAHDDNTSHVRGMLRRIVPDLLSGTEVNTTKTEHNHEATAMKTISAKHTPTSSFSITTSARDLTGRVGRGRAPWELRGSVIYRRRRRQRRQLFCNFNLFVGWWWLARERTNKNKW